MEKLEFVNSVIFKFQNPLNINLKDGEIGLCISVFYNKSNWDTLVIEGISPYIHDKRNKMFFYLSESSGDHLKLVIVVDEKKSYEQAKQLEIYFKNFIKKHPSDFIPKKKKNSNIFKDFSNNSIQFGLFNYFFDESWLRFNIGLSELLIYAFKEYRETFQSELNAIILQVIIIFCNATGISDKKLMIVIKKILKDEYKNCDKSDLKELKSHNEVDFANNKNIIIEYLREYRFKKADSYNEKWESEWHEFSYYSFREILELDFEKKELNIMMVMNKIMTVFNITNRISLCSFILNGIKNYRE